MSIAMWSHKPRSPRLSRSLRNCHSYSLSWRVLEGQKGVFTSAGFIGAKSPRRLRHGRRMPIFRNVSIRSWITRTYNSAFVWGFLSSVFIRLPGFRCKWWRQPARNEGKEAIIRASPKQPILANVWSKDICEQSLWPQQKHVTIPQASNSSSCHRDPCQHTIQILKDHSFA